MNLSLWKKVALLCVVLSAAGVMVADGPLGIGQEKAEKKTQKAKGRLPAYYADVVTDEQKEKIYSIQDKYAKQLKDLNEQVLAVTKKQTEEIEALLSTEQKEQIDKASAAAVAKKKRKAADKKAAEAAKSTTTKTEAKAN